MFCRWCASQGTAISAALLPPVVNSGICLGLCVWFTGDDFAKFASYGAWPVADDTWMTQRMSHRMTQWTTQ